MEKLRAEIEDKYKWDLTRIYKNEEEYNKDVKLTKEITDKILSMKGSLVKDADSLYTYLSLSEEMGEILSKIYVYSFLYYYQDMHDELGIKYKTTAESLDDDISVKLSFTSSELMAAGFKKVQELIKQDDRLKKYAFSLEKDFRYESHILSSKEEEIIAEASKAFGTPDEVFSALDNIDIDLGFIKDESGEKVKLTNSNYSRYMNSKNRNVRKNAFKNMYNYFKNHINIISSSYAGCIKEDFFFSTVRKFESPLEMSLYNDKIDVDFYKYFIEEIHKYLPLLYRYFKIRNKALGYKNHLYDIYVDIVSKNDEDIPFEEGIKHVKNALAPLGDKYLSDLNKAFTNGWIDVYPNKFKRSGAYEWGCYGVEPYVSLNYENNADSVSTMAHELGHAMHTYYSNSKQDYIYANYPIFLAEIASTVNEVLVDDYFFKNATTDDEKILYLQSFLDKVRTTIFRQTMFAEFEMIMHDKHKEGVPITKDELCKTYYDLNKLYFGKNVSIDEDIKYEWSRIPHFYTPFYVYKYATGLVSALSIASSILDGDENAKDNYLEFLSLGASDYPLEILKKANVDIKNPKVIEKAFKLFENKLNELEELVNKREEENERKRLL